MTNDRLKFRVWDKEEKTYNSKKFYSWVLEETGDLLGIEMKEYTDFCIDKVIVEFCTGVKDKNGKLIYAGDIVKTKHDDVGVVIDSNHFLEWRIVFKKGRKHLLDNEEFGVPMFDFTENAIGKNILKVIGNIQENLELLK